MGGMMGGMGGGKGGTQESGISSEQQALAQYNFGQGALRDRASFAGQGDVGMGPSTGETQAIAGSRFNEALEEAKMAHSDVMAQSAFNQQQQNSLQQLASSLTGGLGGSSGGSGGSGGFGGTGGSFG